MLFLSFKVRAAEHLLHDNYYKGAHNLKGHIRNIQYKSKTNANQQIFLIKKFRARSSSKCVPINCAKCLPKMVLTELVAIFYKDTRRCQH